MRWSARSPATSCSMNRALGDPSRIGRQLDLRFRRAPDGGTFLARQTAGFPFHITRPFALDTKPEGMATLIVQSIGAGILQGDRIDMAIEAEAGAAVHLTTQASTVVHSMSEDHAEQTAHVVARDGAFVEYLPDALILFPESRLRTQLRLDVEPGATVLWCDGVIMHDPKGGEGRFSELASETMLSRGGEVTAVDRFVIDGAVMSANGGAATAGYPIHASFGVVTDDDREGLLATLRETADRVDGTYCGFSTLPNESGLWGRVLARDGVAYREAMDVLWRTARRHLTGIEPPSRRK